MDKPRLALFAIALSLLAVTPLRTQDNYEIQIYGSDTVATKTLMTELHSNYSIDGFRAAPGSNYTIDGTYPTNHAGREALELTEGATGGHDGREQPYPVK